MSQVFAVRHTYQGMVCGIVIFLWYQIAVTTGSYVFAQLM